MRDINYDNDPKQGPTGRRSTAFYQAVRKQVRRDFNSAYLSMVKRGQRKNDNILLALITVDHYWDMSEEERKVLNMVNDFFPGVRYEFKNRSNHGILEENKVN